MRTLESSNEKLTAIFTKLLTGTAALLNPERFKRLEHWLGAVGNMMAPITAVLVLITGVVGAVKTDSFMAFVTSLGVVVAFLVAHWCGRALMANCDLAVANTSARVSSYGLFRAFALLALVGFFALLLSGAYAAIRFSMIEPIYWPLVYAAGVGFLVWFLLNPGLLGIEEDPAATPGDDALSISTFGLAGGLRLHRVVFGVGLVSGNLAVARHLFQMVRGDLDYLLELQMAVCPGMPLVFAAALAPIALYLGFVFSALCVDLMRSILRIGR